MANSDTEDFLFEYAIKAADEATAEGRRHRVLGPHERIICVMSVAPVSSRIDELLGMHVETYFTVARFQAAGVEPKLKRQRIIDACLLNTDLNPHLITVRDLLEYGAKRFDHRPNVGKTCCDAIRTIFEHDGITGF